MTKTVEETFYCAKCKKVLGYISIDYMRRTDPNHTHILCQDCREQEESREAMEKRLQRDIEVWIDKESDDICIKVMDRSTNPKRGIIIKLYESDLYNVIEGSRYPSVRIKR
jgi:hypothetical protein